MIEVQGLHHRYGPVTAVEELSFSVGRGEILGLLGPNGAGKTTAMRAVVGLLAPSGGSVRIDGRDLADDPIHARRRLGYLPELVPLYRELTVVEFLRFAAKAKGVSRSRVGGEVERVIEACGLGPVRTRLIGYCSRGYRQRIGLAQAMAGDPPVLVLDEPTVGLDPAQVVDIRDLIAELGRTKAVILSTHILPEASLLCQRVLILDRGRCLADDTPAKLKNSMQAAPRLSVTLRSQPPDLAARLAALDYVSAAEDMGLADDRWRWRLDLRSADATADLVAELVRLGCAVEEIRPDRLDLEDVFLRLVRHEEEAAS
jgi:ABC-2 type transport system ATP-binding protein